MRTRQWCCRCGGTGTRWMQRMAAVTIGTSLLTALGIAERQGTANEMTMCRHCEGRGWLPGFTIPV